MENVVILGSGNAGLTAAIYATRANLNPLVITGIEEGGQLMLTTEVENFPGFPEGILGPELIERMKKQAIRFGARFIQDNAESFEIKSSHFEIKLGDETIKTKTLIVATGASARFLGFESEKKYVGRGVSTCATCDGYFFKDKEIVVVGGGDSACEESLFLAKFVSKLTIIHRRDKLRASKIMQGRVFKNEKISFLWNHAVEEVLGDGNKVTGIKVKDVNTGEITEMKVDGVFIAIGHDPNTKIFRGKLELDEKEYLKVDSRMHTSVKGVFGAGDVADHIYRQAITAAGMGCMAAIEAEKYLEDWNEL